MMRVAEAVHLNAKRVPISEILAQTPRGERRSSSGVLIGCPENDTLQISRSVAAFCGGFLDHFHVNRDVHIVANDYTAVIELGVPLHAVILAVDFCGCRSRYALISPGILCGNGESIYIQHHFLGCATDR